MTKISARLATLLPGLLLAACSSREPAPAVPTAAAPTKSAPTMRCPPAATKPKLLWSLDGFSNPESMAYDPATKVIFVSNVAGGPTDKDGKGWISKVSAQGKLLEAQWATGEKATTPELAKPMNAPKGLAIRSGIVWVSDIDRVEAFQASTGKKTASIGIAGAKFLNDVAFDPKSPGRLYVSDMIGGAIHRIEKSTAPQSAWIEGATLESPNGLRFVDGKLLSVGWGIDIADDFSTRVPGRVLTIDPTTRAVTPWSDLTLGNLDGVEVESRDTLLVSDWLAGKVYRVKKSGECTLLLEGIQGAADIGYVSGQRILLLPRMVENRIEAYQL